MIVLGKDHLTVELIAKVARNREPVSICQQAIAAMTHSRKVVDNVLSGGDQAPAVYGVNTGFGALAEVRISSSQIRELQRNLVRSHSVGVGEPLEASAVRAMMLLRAAVLCRGHSGARPIVAESLVAMLNAHAHPRVPARGSVGASGDLAPLAHLALGLIGEGEIEYEGQFIEAQVALKKAGIVPLELEAKEGLTLLNGTQHMTGIGALALFDANAAADVADIAGAMSLDALKGTARAFDERVIAVRAHPGQVDVGQRLRSLLANSEIAASHEDCGKVQDPYSLRCMPQVHGATRDLLNYATQVIEREANSTTDNPLVFPNDSNSMSGDIISGGNFHGQPVAIALDAAAIAVAELANISERRIEQLVNPQLSSGLPPFLAPQSGLHSGFMIAQVAAASLVSENKVLCHPASVDSIPSSAGREDHVSMGATSALKLTQIVDQVRTVLAIELMCATVGIDLRAPHLPGAKLRIAHAKIRERVSQMTHDRPLYTDIAAVKDVIFGDTFVTETLSA